MIDWLGTNWELLAAAGLAISEILTATPLKSNGIVQLVYNGFKALKDFANK